MMKLINWKGNVLRRAKKQDKQPHMFWHSWFEVSIPALLLFLVFSLLHQHQVMSYFQLFGKLLKCWNLWVWRSGVWYLMELLQTVHFINSIRIRMIKSLSSALIYVPWIESSILFVIRHTSSRQYETILKTLMEIETQKTYL